MTMGQSSRRNRIRRALAAALVALACVPAIAHRRDEYLQASRIAIEPQRIAIELDVTPGIAIAPAFLAEIDRDRDGQISDVEGRAYAALIQGALVIEIDGRSVPLELDDVRWPTPNALTRGEGVIRVVLTSGFPPLDSGRHVLRYRNDHHPAGAAYLANALSPASSEVVVRGQQRDIDQRELTIEYTLDSRETTGVPWLLIAGLIAEVAGIVGLGFVVRRLRREQRARIV